MNDLSRTLRDRLAPFQRRALIVGIVRRAAVGIAGALLLSAVAMTFMRPGVIAWLTMAVLFVAGLSIAVIVAMVSRPHVRETARRIDSACRCDNAISTAVQFSDASDPVAHLVVRQAIGRLETIAPPAAFPWEFGFEAKALVAAAVVAIMVIAATVAELPGWPRTSGAGGVSIAGEADDVSRRAGSPADRSTAAGEAPRSVSGLPRNRRESDQAASEASGQNPAAASARPDAATSQRASSGGREQGGQGASEGAGDAAAPGADVGQRRAGAGGVRAGQLAPRGSAGAAVSSAAFADRYRDAVGRAEQAVAREDVPMEMRETVRTYFTAIRP